MAHNDPRIRGDLEAHLMGRKGALIDAKFSMTVVSNSRGIFPSGLTGSGQDRENVVSLLLGQGVAVVDNSKQAAHYSSSSPETGSLT